MRHKNLRLSRARWIQTLQKILAYERRMMLTRIFKKKNVGLGVGFEPHNLARIPENSSAPFFISK